MTKRVWTWGIVGYLILRWILMSAPGYFLDLPAYKRWAIHLARGGIARIYQNTDMDYPPLYAYLLAPIGKFYGWIAPEALTTFGDSTIFTLLVKLPPFIFDLAVAWLLYRLGKRIEAQGTHWKLGFPRYVLPTVYLLNPAILYNHAFGGQPDSVLCFLVLAAFLAICRGVPEGPDIVGLGGAGRGRPPGAPSQSSFRAGGGWIARWTRGAWPAWVLLTLAVCMKPLAAPYFPLLLVVSLSFYRLRSTTIGMGAAAVTAFLVFLPFLIAGQITPVLTRILGDVEVMPFTSSNANNLWWVLGPWKSAKAPLLGPLTPNVIALSLFGATYLFLLWQAHRLHHRQPGGLRGAQILALAAAVGFSFFMLSTQMHENHLIMLIPLLAALIPAGRAWRWFFVLVSFSVVLACWSHDPPMAVKWPLNAGGTTSIEYPPLHRTFFVVELGFIWFGTVLNLATYAAFMALLFRGKGKGLVERLGQDR